jgi:hypothetical protein
MPRRLFWPSAAPVLLAAMAFGPAVANEFVDYDDVAYAIGVRRVQGGLTPGNLAWAWTSFNAGHRHPLTWMSLQPDATLYDSAAVARCLAAAPAGRVPLRRAPRPTRRSST